MELNDAKATTATLNDSEVTNAIIKTMTQTRAAHLNMILSPEIEFHTSARGNSFIHLHLRVVNWEHRLADAIIAARGAPFAWGSHDCATWAFDLRRDLTGGPDHAALWRGRYRTPVGCQRVLRRLGWKTLEEGGRVLLGEPLADPRLAQRGDLVLGGEPEAFGVCIGAQAGFVSPEGLVTLPLSFCRLAWRT